MQNCSVNQSALLSGFRTDLRHQYGISGRKSQTSLFAFLTHVVAGTNERWLYLQTTVSGIKKDLIITPVFYTT